MYGRGAGDITSVATGTASTVAGFAVLPNTGGNPYLIALSLLGVAAGLLILGSFTVTRIASNLHRK